MAHADASTGGPADAVVGGVRVVGDAIGTVVVVAVEVSVVVVVVGVTGLPGSVASGGPAGSPTGGAVPMRLKSKAIRPVDRASVPPGSAVCTAVMCSATTKPLLRVTRTESLIGRDHPPNGEYSIPVADRNR
jgi:hypothetical protein